MFSRLGRFGGEKAAWLISKQLRRSHGAGGIISANRQMKVGSMLNAELFTISVFL